MGRGFDDPRSALVWVVPVIRDIVVSIVPVSVGHLLENVKSMDDADRDAISRIMGSSPQVVDAAEVAACSRPRLFWNSMGHVDVASDPVDADAILEPGWRPVWELVRGSKNSFRTFLRPFEAGAPTECPESFPRLPLSSYDARGLVYRPDSPKHQLDKVRAFISATAFANRKSLRRVGSPALRSRVAFARWIHCQGGDEVVRPLSGDERDRALGFPSGASFSQSWIEHQPVDIEFRRWEVTGNAFSPSVVAQLLQPLFQAVETRQPIPEKARPPRLRSREEVFAMLRSN